MKLFALTFGGTESASTHYRLFQYQDLMAERGIEFAWQEAKPFSDYPRLADYDVVILQKTILSASRLKRIRRHARRLVYDADDRIWLSPQRQHHWLTRWRIDSRMRRIAAEVDICVAANQVIAGDLRGYGGKVEVIPMSVDLSFWRDCSDAVDHPVIGWSGAPKNTEFLRQISAQLKALKARFPEVEICVHSGKAPDLDGLPYTHMPYVPGEENLAVCSFDIGLLPLPDDEFVAGKSPIKSLQYMASGAVVVGNGVGAATEIMIDGETGLHVRDESAWVDVLGRLLEDDDYRRSLQSRAKTFVEQIHAREVVFDRWIRLISEPN